MSNISRRTFLCGACSVAGLFAVGGVAATTPKNGELLRPPGGQDEASFLAACLRCDKCRSICPENCISICVLEDGWLNYRTPRIDFHKGQCTFCGECIDVCPTRALAPFDESTDKIGVARVDPEQCIAYKIVGCQACKEHCPYDAITMDETGKPQVNDNLCNGCGRCEFACPSASLGSYDGSKLRGINVVKAERG